jgi:Ribbon-helix-helix protein, copG family
MIRTQISLTPDQMRRLRAEARRRRTSIAGVIRDAVDIIVPEDDWEERKRRALAAIGTGNSGLTDVAENHDEYVAEAIAQHLGLDR